MPTKLIDGKKVIVKANSKNIPSYKTIKDTYAKIPDNKRIPIVFETKEQYLNEYIKNQEKAKNIQFTEAQKQQYRHNELNNMKNIVSRYTTNHNPYIDRRTVFFNDHKIPEQQFKDSALHEYGHELWEKNPKIRNDWKSVSRSSSPTSYGATSKQEDFAESFMLAKTGRLQDPKREHILSDAVAQNRTKVMPWHGNIEQQSIQNPNFRKIVFTGNHAQISLMSIKPGQDAGLEKHNKVDQFFRIEQGKAQFQLNKGKTKFTEGPSGAAMIPAGTWHNVLNTGKKPLKLYTIYSPPNHPAGTIQKDKPSKNDLSTVFPFSTSAEFKYKVFGDPKTYNPIFETSNIGEKVNIMAKDRIGDVNTADTLATSGFNIQGFGGVIKETPTTDRTSWNSKKKVETNSILKDISQNDKELYLYKKDKDGVKKYYSELNDNKDIMVKQIPFLMHPKHFNPDNPKELATLTRGIGLREAQEVVPQNANVFAVRDTFMPFPSDKKLAKNVTPEINSRAESLLNMSDEELLQIPDTDNASNNMAKVYHGTDKLKAYFITKEGLKTSKELDKTYDTDEADSKMSNQTDPNHTYFFEKPEHARAWAKVVSEQSGVPHAIVEADIPDEELELDLNMPYGKAFKKQGGVQANKLKIYDDKDSEDYHKDFVNHRITDQHKSDLVNQMLYGDTISRNMPFVKKTTVPVVDSPNEYDSYTEKRTVKMSPDKFLESTKIEAADSESQRGHHRNALQLLKMPVEEYAEGSWWPAEKDYDREGKALRHGWKQPSRVERVKKGLTEGKNIPGLYLEQDETGRIIGHEGRHRAIAARELGIEKVPVHIMTERKNMGYIEPKNRNVQVIDTIPGEFEGEPSNPFEEE